MQIINLYKYIREDGGITVSPVKPEVEYTEMFRLIADKGFTLTLDEENIYSCIDVEFIDGWHEIEYLEEEEIIDD